MSFVDRISINQLDILKEIGNIGAGNAATSLSKLLNRRIDMDVPAVRIVSFSEIMEMVGGPEEIIASVFIRIQGEAPCNMFFVLSPEQADQFVIQITGNHDFKEVSNENMAISALQEIGNILSGSYITALSDFTKISMKVSVPSLSIDMAGAILSNGLVELSNESDYAIVIDTMIEEHEEKNKSIQGHFLLLPDPESFEKICTALEVLPSE
jgi:chemotaxis protein CheC